CDLAAADVAVLPPAALRDRLAYGPERLEGELVGPARRRLTNLTDRRGAGLGAAGRVLSDFVEQLAERFAAEDRARESRQVAEQEAYQDERGSLTRRAEDISQRLERVELAALDL